MDDDNPKDANERLHRADPVRTGPIRAFSQMYRGAAPSRESGSPEKPREESSPKLNKNGSAGETVALAYQVIQKYIDAGRRAAEDLGKSSYNQPKNSGDALQQLLDKTLSFQAEILPAWLDVLAGCGKSLIGCDSSLAT